MFVSQYWGKKDVDGIRKTMGMNVLANYAFIFGNLGMPELGVAGAAVGTVVTRGSELTILLIYLFTTKNEVISNIPEMFHYSRDGFLTFLKKALPLAGNEFFWGVGTTLYFTIYGHIGTEQLAAMSIMSIIQTMEQTFSLSLSSSASVIVGNQIGGGDREEVFRCGARFHRLAVFVGVFVAAFIFLFIHPIVGLYGIMGTEAGIYLTQCLTILCCYLSVTFLFGEVLKMPIAVVYSAFIGTDLDLLLQCLHVDTVFLIGGLTDVCVHFTAVDAHQRNYHIHVLREACHTHSPKDVAEAAFENMDYFQTGAVMSVEDLEA